MDKEMAYTGKVETISKAYESNRTKSNRNNIGTKDFGEYLDVAHSNGQAEKNASKPAERERKTEQAVRKPKQEDVKQKQNSKNEAEKTEAVKEPDTEKVEQPAAEKPEQEQAEIENRAVKLVAKLLDEPYDKVMEILNSLGLNVFDLLNNGNLLNFMKEAFAASTDSELLTIANIKDLYVEIASGLTQLADELTQTPEAALVPDTVTVAKNIDVGQTNPKTAELSEEVIDGLNPEITESTAANDGVNTDPVVDEENIVPVRIENVNNTEITEAVEQTEIDEILPDTAVTAVEDGLTDLTSSSRETNYDGQRREPERNNNGEIDFRFLSAQIQNNTNQNIMFRETQLRSQMPSNINTRDVVNQIVERIKVDVSANVSEVRLTLRPESLGEVSLKISMENGIVTAQFTAENQRIKALIESNFSELKDALQQQGVGVAELYVTVGQGQDQAQERMDNYLRNRQKNAGRIMQIIRSGFEDEEEASALEAGDAIMDVMV